MDSLSTALLAIVVFLTGQGILRFVIEPIHEFNKLRGEIAEALTFYAHVYSNPGVARDDLMQEAHRSFRSLGSKVIARAYGIPFYQTWALCKLVPPQRDLEEAASNLIGISYTVFKHDPGRIDPNEARRKTIEKTLRLYMRAAAADAPDHRPAE